MKTISTILLIASGGSVLLAIWQPFGTWWQWAITALVLLLAAAGIGGAAGKTQPYAKGGIVGPQVDHDQNVAVRLSGSITPDDVEKYKRSYGKKADR
ncbi:MAG: hypothetical protein ACTIA5_01500 [Brachybacterium tyrofermentans]